MPAALPPSRKQAPVSPMSSPQHQPAAALPAAPALPRRTSSHSARLHLHRQEEPPIPPRLVGSPLLNNLINPHAPAAPKQPPVRRAQWIDGDEFGTASKQGAAAAPRYTSAAPVPPAPMQGAKFSIASYGRCAIEARGLTVEFTTIQPSSRGVPA